MKHVTSIIIDVDRGTIYDLTGYHAYMTKPSKVISGATNFVAISSTSKLCHKQTSSCDTQQDESMQNYEAQLLVVHLSMIAWIKLL